MLVLRTKRENDNGVRDYRLDHMLYVGTLRKDVRRQVMTCHKCGLVMRYEKLFSNGAALYRCECGLEVLRATVQQAIDLGYSTSNDCIVYTFEAEKDEKPA